MTEKLIINSAENCVGESLYGFSKIHPDLTLYPPDNIVIDENPREKKKVALISGGGSGHEPFPTGYVGSGMLTASISGSVFTSPPSSQILKAIRLASLQSEEILIIVPNYTGDVLNFGLGVEMAINEGKTVETLIVGEDIAQEVHGITNKAGKRGMCGLVLIFKIAGYLSEISENLQNIQKLSSEALKSMATLGLCVSPCSKPGVGYLFHLNKDEVELGVGVHGEAGVARFKLMCATEAVEMILKHLKDYLNVREGDEVVVLVNNLGSLSYIEEWLLAGEVEKQLTEKKISVLRLYAGRFFTSLNMSGMQICLLKIVESTKNIFLPALDHPTTAFSWPKALFFPKTDRGRNLQLSLKPQRKFEQTLRLQSNESDFLKKCFTSIANNLIKEESYINDLDSICGDGDCGTTFHRIGSEILKKDEENALDFSRPVALFNTLCTMMQESIGGTSGALYGLFFQGISNELENENEVFDIVSIVLKCWKAGIDSIKKYSRARIGDRTMLDSLETAFIVFEEKIQEKALNVLEGFKAAVEASRIACERTKSMRASAGRASYTDQSQQTNMDAGAYAVTVWLSTILGLMESLRV